MVDYCHFISKNQYRKQRSDDSTEYDFHSEKNCLLYDNLSLQMAID